MLRHPTVPFTVFAQNCSIVWCNDTRDAAVIDPGADIERFWIDALPQQGEMFGFPPSEAFTPTRWLVDGDTVQIGHCTLDVRHFPGHAPGHVVFHSKDARRAFVGDVLFAGGIGRIGIPGCNHAQPLASTHERLWPMGDDTVFVPGHGPESTFGEERRFNPYLAVRAAAHG